MPGWRDLLLDVRALFSRALPSYSVTYSELHNVEVLVRESAVYLIHELRHRSYVDVTVEITTGQPRPLFQDMAALNTLCISNDDILDDSVGVTNIAGIRFVCDLDEYECVNFKVACNEVMAIYVDLWDAELAAQPAWDWRLLSRILKFCGGAYFYLKFWLMFITLMFFHVYDEVGSVWNIYPAHLCFLVSWDHAYSWRAPFKRWVGEPGPTPSVWDELWYWL